LIEYAYYSNGGEPVVVLSLSMGGPVFMLFLNHFVDQEWRSKFIDSYVSLDGAFGGSLSAVETVVSASSWLKTFGNGELLRGLVQTYGSVAWLLPDRDIFGGNRTFVGNPKGNYTVDQLSQILNQANATLTIDMLQSILKQGLNGYQAPGVPVHIIHGVNVSTPSYALYNTTGMENEPYTVYGDGDGTILLEGLTYLAKYNSTQSPVYLYPIKGMFHGGSVHNAKALKIVLQVILK